MAHTLEHAEAKLREATAKFVAMLVRRGLENTEYTVTPKDLEGWRITRSVAAWSRAVRLAKREAARHSPNPPAKEQHP